MANLKVDLLTKLRSDKYFVEIELARLASDPNMNYREKIELMQIELEELALLNAEMGLVEQYFQEAQQPAPQGVPQPAPQGQVHNGQSHGEA